MEPDEALLVCVFIIGAGGVMEVQSCVTRMHTIISNSYHVFKMLPKQAAPDVWAHESVVLHFTLHFVPPVLSILMFIVCSMGVGLETALFGLHYIT